MGLLCCLWVDRRLVAKGGKVGGAARHFLAHQKPVFTTTTTITTTLTHTSARPRAETHTHTHTGEGREGTTGCPRLPDALPSPGHSGG